MLAVRGQANDLHTTCVCQQKVNSFEPLAALVGAWTANSVRSME